MSLSKRGVPKPPRTDEHRKNLYLAISRGNKHFRWDGNIYKFYHPEYGVKICDRHTLISKYGLHERGVGYLVSGERPTHKGWRMHE